MTDTTIPSEGALTLDQVTEMLTPSGAPEGAAEAAAQGGEQGADQADAPGDREQTEGETSTADGASEAEEPGDGEDEAADDEGAVESLSPPAYWSKDAKAQFAELPPALQAVVLSQEGPREAAAAKAKADAAEEVKAARTQAQGVQALAQQLGTFLPEALETFQQRWGDPDWEATIRQYGAEQAAILKARHDKEQGQLQQLAQATQEARTQAHQTFVMEQFQTLATLDPELAPDVKDPSKGADKRQEVAKYLMDNGIGRDAVAQISAVEMTMARKAMLWDRAQAAAQARPAQRQQPPLQRRSTPKPGARPGGAAAASPQSQDLTSAQNRFNAKPTLDNLTALLLARGQG